MKYTKQALDGRIRLLLFCMFFVVFFMPEAWATPPVRVSFIVPTPPSDVPFWNDYVEFMKAAANNLGMELTVAVSDNRFEEADNVGQALQALPKPDYLIHIYQAGTSVYSLDKANKAGVKTVIVNTDVADQDRDLVGYPREKYPLWIGHIYPDDIEAGRLLMDILIEKAKSMGLYADDNKIHAIGIGGNLLATSSIYREEGMRESLKAHSDILLKRYVLGRWDRNISYGKATKLLDLYPETKIVWAVNDHTAMGAMLAMAGKGIKAGTDALIGGIDWSQESINEVKKGRMVTSIGGHFMEGAWALIMILDYHNGHDFAAPSPTLRSHMSVINAENINFYSSILDQTNWENIDFKSLSKTYNPKIKEYDFSPEVILRQLDSR